MRSLSIQAKTFLTLTAVFALVIICSLLTAGLSQRQLATDIAIEQTHQAANSFLDSFNVLMLTRTTKERDALKDKFESQSGIREARILRAPVEQKRFGAGKPWEQVQDDWDRQALAGQSLVKVHRDNKGQRLVTVERPIKASTDYRGTDCLDCHHVKAGTVLGAVRVTYSLAAVDARISRNLFKTGGVMVGLFVLGLVLMAFVLRRVAIRRIGLLSRFISEVEESSDLTRRMPDSTPDEIGKVTTAINKMLARFQASLQQVSRTTRELSQAAAEIDENARTTANAVQEQRDGTEMMAAAMNEMESTSNEVRQNAEHTRSVSAEADEQARSGARLTDTAIQAISALSKEVGRAADVIEALNTKAQGVGSVLDVIKGVAEQTKLLALNAAIEAARAGESGRGFAVVADEVRSLATKTQESTREIEAMIEGLQTDAQGAVETMRTAYGQADESVEQVRQATDLLQAIAERVSRINELNSQMAAVAEDQSKAAGEVNANVARISETAEQSSRDAEETAQLSRTVTDLARQLETMVARFRILCEQQGPS